MSGKKKHNAVPVDPKTQVCEIRVLYTEAYRKEHPKIPANYYKSYKVRSFINNAKIIEINSRLAENPKLLLDSPETDGFIAVFQFNGDQLNVEKKLNEKGPKVVSVGKQDAGKEVDEGDIINTRNNMIPQGQADITI